MLTQERIDCAVLDLRNECAHYMTELGCGEKEQCEKCYIPTALEALEKAEKFKWTPVKVRPTTEEDGIDMKEYPLFLDFHLPDYGERILVSLGDYVDIDVSMPYGLCSCYLDEHREWDDVDAWMPLPKPYAEPWDNRDLLRLEVE